MAVLVAAGRAAAGTVPAAILTLTEGVLHAMAMTKWKMAALALIASGVLASGALVSAQQSAESVPAPSPARAEPDRLRIVEEKLTKLLHEFEAAFPHLAAAPATVTTPAPAPVRASEPAATPRIARDPFGATGAITAPSPYATPAQPRLERQPFGHTAPVNRALEDRVRALEERLDKVEHAFAELVAATLSRSSTRAGARPRDDGRQ
jgi:hypothetical protein